MANDGQKHIDVPNWLAAILFSVILAIAGDTWRTVYNVRRELDCLKTALSVKGIIDPKIVQAGQDTAKLTCFSGIPENSANTPKQ